jgi:anti-sigma B factor antagonist
MAQQEYVHIDRLPSEEAGADSATFIVRGELDIGNVDRLTMAVAAAATESAHVVLDLSGLGFIDCSGVSALIAISNAVGPGGRVIIRRPSPQVTRVLQLVGADRFERFVIANT